MESILVPVCPGNRTCMTNPALPPCCCDTNSPALKRTPCFIALNAECQQSINAAVSNCTPTKSKCDTAFPPTKADCQSAFPLSCASDCPPSKQDCQTAFPISCSSDCKSDLDSSAKKAKDTIVHYVTTGDGSSWGLPSLEEAAAYGSSVLPSWYRAEYNSYSSLSDVTGRFWGGDIDTSNNAISVSTIISIPKFQVPILL